MRITNNMMVNTLMQDLQNSLALVQKYNKEAMGRRVHRPSDDPVATSKILKFSTDLSELEQYKSNISDADSLFKVTESSISEVSEVLQRLKDLAERAANETFTGEDHLKFQSEIKAIFDQLVTNANFNFLGKYVFSGFETDKPLMNKDGSYAVDVTDSQINGVPKLNLLVGSGERMAISTHGFEVFGVVKDYGVFNNVIADTSGILPKKDKLTIMGKLDLNSNINGDVHYVIAGEIFTAKISGMNGSDKLEVDRNVLLEKIKEAKNAAGTKKLGEVASVYFDSHDNLIVDVRDVPAAINYDNYRASTTLFHSATHFSGSPATTSEAGGKFALTGPDSNYIGLKNQEIKVEAGNYVPPADAPETYFIQKAGENRISRLNGNVREIGKDEIIKLIKSSPNAAGTSVLSDRYDVFFDTNDQLVIKLKVTKDSDYGNRTIDITGFPPASYSPVTKEGKETAETKSVFTGYTFTDDYVFKNADKLEKDAIYIEYNGDKKRIVPSGVAVTDVDSYVQGLQNTLNKEFGVGKVEVKKAGALAGPFHLTFETKNTKFGETPTLRIEATRVKESSLMRDIKDLIADLDENDYEGVRKFLDKFHPHYERILAIRAEIGGKTRRLEFATERMKDNHLAFTDMLSKQRDADFEQSITKFKNAEAVYHAALMMGSKIIQPSLLDFLR